MTYPATVILSPHLDDAVFSLGGALSQRLLGSVLVVNVFSVSRYALGRGLDDGDPYAVTRRRLAEDRRAMRRLGVGAEYWGLPDSSVKPEYADEAAYLDPAADPRRDVSWPVVFNRIARLFERHPGAVVLAPLGVGAHIEHRIVAYCCRTFLNEGRSVAFYEDGSYFRGENAARECASHLGLHVGFTISGVAWERKQALVDVYTSQVTDDVRANIRRAYQQHSGERVWSSARTIDEIAQLVRSQRSR